MVDSHGNEYQETPSAAAIREARNAVAYKMTQIHQGDIKTQEKVIQNLQDNLKAAKYILERKQTEYKLLGLERQNLEESYKTLQGKEMCRYSDY